MRILLRVVLGLALVWVAFVVVVYGWMTKPPEEFAARIARLPLPAMMAFPFETMWLKARAGALRPGDVAPDFDLQTVDRTSRVRLSGYRGRPVVLVFGSYT
jgi:hypothetical protein